MSIHHLERAAELRMHATRKLVFMALCDDADKTTGIAFPGLEKIIAWAGCAKSQAQAHLAALIEDGYVERVEAGATGRRATFRVFAMVPCCAEHAPAEGSGQPDPSPAAAAVDNRPQGSGQPDADRAQGSGKGPVRVRSGPDASPTPQLPTTASPPPARVDTRRAGGPSHVLDKPAAVVALEQAFAARERIRHFTPFHRLSLGDSERLVELVAWHGVERLADHAAATALTARSWRAFVPDWEAMAGPVVLAPDLPRCEVCNQTEGAHSAPAFRDHQFVDRAEALRRTHVNC